MSADDVQARVQAAIDRRVRSGAEVGLQVAVLRYGQPVVDAVSGRCDAGGTRPVAPDTLFYAASTAKGVASAVAHVLLGRGELDDDLRAVDVWPELGQRGKEGMTLRHVLLHTAGVPAPPYDTTVRDLCDWDHMCEVLAAAEPWWAPGTRFGYHAQTFGFLLGEIVRRATGRTLSRWLRDAVTGPLGVEDEVHFGVPEDLLARVAHQHPALGPPPEPPPGSPADRAVPPGIRPDADLANRPDVLRADIIATGTMSARGVARLYAGLRGDVEGVELVSPERRTEMAALTYEGEDAVMGVPATWAYGFSPYRPGGVVSRQGSTFGMVGANGSVAYADIDSGVAVAVMRNRFDPDLSAAAEVDRIVAEAFGPDPAEEPTAQEPTAQEPTVEEPTVEEPTVEEPTVEEPTAEERSHDG